MVDIKVFYAVNMVVKKIMQYMLEYHITKNIRFRYIDYLNST